MENLERLLSGEKYVIQTWEVGNVLRSIIMLFPRDLEACEKGDESL